MPRLLGRYLGLRSNELLQSPSTDSLRHLDDLVNQGVIDGLITDQQAQELESIDIFVIAEDGDNKTVYVVVEASIVVDDHDVNRALERATVLGRLTNAPVRAAVVGQDISTAQPQAGRRARSYVHAPLMPCPAGPP